MKMPPNLLLSIVSVLLCTWLSFVNCQTFHDQSTGIIAPNNRSYFVLASKSVRPGQVYSLTITIFDLVDKEVPVRASIKRHDVELISDSQRINDNKPTELKLKVPTNALPGDYKLRVELNLNEVWGGISTVRESSLNFLQRSMTIFISTDKPIYNQGQVVKFRCLPITTALKAFTDSVDVFIRDPNNNLIKRWLSRQTNLGAVSLEFQLSNQPVFGKWKVEVIAQGQSEIREFIVEEYYQTRFEVNVEMPTLFKTTDKYIYGDVMANFTSGVPVIGNLTIEIYITSTRNSISYSRLGENQYVNRFDNRYDSRFEINRYDQNENRFINRYEPTNRYPNLINYEPTPLTRKEYRFFTGHMKFNFSLEELNYLNNGRPLENSKIIIKAYVGERFLNLIYSGFSSALIYNSQLKLKIIGSSPKVFKVHMPIKIYCAISNQDGSVFVFNNKTNTNLTVALNMHNGIRSEMLPTRQVALTNEDEGIWEINLELYKDIQSIERLNEVKRLRLEARYTSSDETVTTFVDLFPAYTENKRFLQISTSTDEPRVGEYITFHVRSNYQVDLIYYVVVSKGIILLNSYQRMAFKSKTFSVVLAPEMVPASSILVYYISNDGQVVADSLSFPVEPIGITKKNFNIELNDKKDKTGKTVEVKIYGEQGTYVGLSALDKDLHQLDTESYFNYADVLKKMGTFDSKVSDILTYSWYSNDGVLSKYKQYASTSLGIDANRTFEKSNLIVFTDGIVARRLEPCNETAGQLPCLDGNQCYNITERCDRHFHCLDRTDESNCPDEDNRQMNEFKLTKSSRLLRLYENSWLFKDFNIGSLGYYIFKIPVPDTPTTWLVNAFAMNSENGFGFIRQPIEFSSIKRFLMNIEMPSLCIIGEQISVRVNLFNYMPTKIEVVVILNSSPDYKFVHVEENGVVSAYNPRTSFGEHQHLVFIKPTKTMIVYLPVVPQRLGIVTICIAAKTQASQHLECKNITVEADGIPQYLHTSTVIDLSQGAQLIKYLDTNLTDTPIIPYSRERRYVFGSNKVSVSVVGDVVGAAFPSLPMNTMNILRMPDAAAEQNMFNFAYNMYMLLYMRSIGVLQNVKVQNEAFNHLSIMYQKQLSYQSLDGGFRMFKWDNRPSVWLTAFCARILHKATFQEWENHLYIDKKIIEKAISWILNFQTQEGSFYEPFIRPHDRKMNFTSKQLYDYRPVRNITLTAHVVITLAQVRDLSGEIGSKVATARYIAEKYLESVLNIIEKYDDPYDLAIVTYALSVVNSVASEDGYVQLDSKMREIRGMKYWAKEPVPPPKAQSENNRPYLLPRDLSKYDSSAIETTAYALLVHMRKQSFIQQEIVEWLNTYRLHDNGWCSTQDSIVALEAIFEYSMNSRLRDVTNIDVNIEAPSSANFSVDLKINQDNIVKLNKYQLPNAYGPVIVKVSGSGVALVQLDVQYNVDWAHLQIQPPIPAFNLDVLMKSYGRNASHIEFESCQRWTNLRESMHSGLAVLDITIPTGYLIQQQDLDQYVRSGQVRNLREAKYSERKMYFYFDYLDYETTCVKFTVQRWYPVANMTRYIYARVYDYYAPERFNETIINAYNLYVLSVCHSCASYQCPYCEHYSFSNLIKPNLLLFIVVLFLSITRFHQLSLLN